MPSNEITGLGALILLLYSKHSKFDLLQKNAFTIVSA